MSKDSGVWIRWGDIWQCLEKVLETEFKWNTPDIDKFRNLTDKETQRRLNTLMPLGAYYIRIDYGYGNIKPPIWFDTYEEATKEIPVSGASEVFVVGKAGVRSQDKYWYSSAEGKWKSGRATG